MPPHNAPSWKKLVSKLGAEVEFAKKPATEAGLAAAERALGVPLPPPLRELLREADGLSDEYGGGAVWSAADIERRNRQFRTNADFRALYMPFDALLFFADDGGGDQFAFAVHADGRIHKNDVYRWEHENDARSWFAGRLEQYLEKRLKREDD